MLLPSARDPPLGRSRARQRGVRSAAGLAKRKMNMRSGGPMQGGAVGATCGVAAARSGVSGRAEQCCAMRGRTE